MPDLTRRSVLKALGLGALVVAVAPEALLPAAPGVVEPAEVYGKWKMASMIKVSNELLTDSAPMYEALIRARLAAHSVRQAEDELFYG